MGIVTGNIIIQYIGGICISIVVGLKRPSNSSDQYLFPKKDVACVDIMTIISNTMQQSDISWD